MQGRQTRPHMSQEVVADEEQFAAEQLAAKQKQQAQAKIQTDINRERQKIAEKKVHLHTLHLALLINLLVGSSSTEQRMGYRETRTLYV